MTEKVELGHVQVQLDRNITWLCCHKKELDGSEKFPRNQSRCTVRLEPDWKPNRTSRRASNLPGVGAPGQLLSRDCLTTTIVRTTHGAEH